LPFSEDQLPQSGARATMPSAALYESDLGIDEAYALHALTPAQREYYSMFPNGKALAVKHGMQELSKQPGAFVGTPDVTPSKHTSKVPYFKTEAPQPKDPLRMSLEDYVNRKGAPTPEWYTEGGKYADKAGDYLTRKEVPKPRYTSYDPFAGYDEGYFLSNTPEYENLVRKYGRGEVAKRIASNLYQGTIGNYIQGAKDFGSRVKGYAESMVDVPEQLAYVTNWYGTENDPRNMVKPVDVVAPQPQQVTPQVAPLQKQPAVESRQAPIIDKAELIKPQIGGADQRTMAERMQLRPTQADRTAPSRTPYDQAIQPSAPAVGAGAPPAQQAQPQQQEEQDLSLSDYMKQYREVTGENKGISVLQNRLSEREARLAKEEDRAPWLALMQAGLATMAGTSPNAMANIGQGGVAGLQAYTRSMNKLEDAKDKSFDIQAKLEEAQRAEELAAAKYGLESVQADKKAKQTARLEREKMAAQKAMNDADNAARLQVEKMQVGASKYAVDARKAAYGDTGAGKKEVTQYQYGQLVDKASDNVDKMIKDQMLSLTMSPEELSEYRQRMINTELQRMVNSTGGGNIAPAPQQTSVLPGYNLLSSK
jgi:hypothetical protein